jgi:phenylacetate-CoA ligase
MTTKAMREFLGRIDSERPAQVYGHPENLFELARFAQAQGIRPYPPKSVVSSGATLSASMRPAIEAAFAAPIFDRYGSREAYGIAAECEAHQGLHVCPVLQYVEILGPDGSPAPPGELGEVVVTTLTSYAMPLIRYRIGDMSAWAEDTCSCGRAWPLLREVAGRTRDLFVRRDGTRVRILESVFHRHSWIRRFQVIQEDFDAVRAFIVPHDEIENAKKNHAAGIAQVEAAIRHVMGPECKVEVILTNQIEASPSGKHLYHMSKVRSS